MAAPVAPAQQKRRWFKGCLQREALYPRSLGFAAFPSARPTFGDFDGCTPKRPRFADDAVPGASKPLLEFVRENDEEEEGDDEDQALTVRAAPHSRRARRRGGSPAPGRAALDTRCAGTR